MVSVRSARVLCFPDPRHQLIQPRDLVIREALQHPCEPGFGIDVVHLCGLDESVGDCSSLTAADGAHEEVVLTAERDGAD